MRLVLVSESLLDLAEDSIYSSLVKPFEEIVQFIADAAGAEKLGSFRPSAAAERRVSELLAKQRDGTLRPKELEELQMFVQLDHVMSLAKARSRSRRRPRVSVAA